MKAKPFPKNIVRQMILFFPVSKMQELFLFNHIKQIWSRLQIINW